MIDKHALTFLFSGDQIMEFIFFINWIFIMILTIYTVSMYNKQE